ncbi:MAG: NACHT domain-containing protein, partial [Planctomycetota bacterium]
MKSLQDFIRRYPKCLFLATSRVVGYDEVPLDLPPDDAARNTVQTLVSMMAGSTAKKVVEQFAVPSPWSDLVGGTAGGLANWALESLPRSTRERLPLDCYYLLPFDNHRIHWFLHHWFRKRAQEETLPQRSRNSDERGSGRGAAESPLSDQLFAALQQNPTMLQLERTPNLLTLLALIYRQRRHLPHGRAMLFKLITEAYLASIDQARGIRAVAYSLSQQTAWLAKIAFRMQQRRAATATSEPSEGAAPEAHTNILVSRSELLAWLQELMAPSHGAMGSSDTVEKAAEKYLDIVARRSGLLLPRGTRNGEPMYAFQHLALQDYFSALYLSSILLMPRWIDGKNQKADLSCEDFRELSKQSTWRE